MNTNLLSYGVNPAGRITNPIYGGKALQGFEVLTQKEYFLTVLIPNAVGLLLVFGGAAFFFMILLGSVQWITSSGEKAGIEAARSKITNALIGLVLMIAAFAVAKLVETFFNINILTIDIGPLVIQ